jgi:hypothetical protein
MDDMRAAYRNLDLKSEVTKSLSRPWGRGSETSAFLPPGSSEKKKIRIKKVKKDVYQNLALFQNR